MQQFTIEKLTKKDHAPAMEIYKRVVADMHARGFMQWNDKYPNGEILTEDIAKGTAWGAFLDGELAAAISIDPNQSPEYEPIPFEFGGPFRVVHRLAVDPLRQGSGIARKLMDFAEEHARAAGCIAMRLDTCEDNNIALGLYEGRGYVRRGTCKFLPRTFTFIVMEKKL